MSRGKQAKKKIGCKAANPTTPRLWRPGCGSYRYRLPPVLVFMAQVAGERRRGNLQKTQGDRPSRLHPGNPLARANRPGRVPPPSTGVPYPTEARLGTKNALWAAKSSRGGDGRRPRDNIWSASSRAPRSRAWPLSVHPGLSPRPSTHNMVGTIQSRPSSQESAQQAATTYGEVFRRCELGWRQNKNLFEAPLNFFCV